MAGNKKPEAIDFSNRRLEELSLPFPEPKRPPVLTDVELQRLAQTTLDDVGPDLALYLHGPGLQPADVYIVWREDLTEDDLLDPSPENRQRLREYAAVLPPFHFERLPLPSYAVERWLSGVRSDAGAVEGEMAPENGGTPPGRPVLLYRASAGVEIGRGLRFRSGDIVFVPAAYGGVDGFGWNPTGEAGDSDHADVYTAGILDGLEAVPRFLNIPLTVRTLHRIPDEGLREEAEKILTGLAINVEAFGSGSVDLRRSAAADSPAGAILAFLEKIVAMEEADEHLRRLALFLRTYADAVFPHPLFDRSYGEEALPRGLIFVVSAESYRMYLREIGKEPDASLPAPAFEDETDVDGESLTQRDIELDAHLVAVEKKAEHFLRSLGLTGTPVAGAVRLAARYHDVGKLDPRFQHILRGGKEKPLAKSKQPAMGLRALEKLYRRAGWPFRKRHEYLSVLILEDPGSQTELNRVDPDVRALALYLIGTHHGYGRPFFPQPAWEPEKRWVPLSGDLFGGETLTLNPSDDLPEASHLASGWPDRFFAMQKRYGIYGLAYLEAILRLADAAASEDAVRL